MIVIEFLFSSTLLLLVISLLPVITGLEGANGGLLANWSPKTSKADITVAKDGSGNYTTIGEAMDSLAHTKRDWTRRAIVYVKTGIYNERVVVTNEMTNIMLIGDGINNIVATGDLNQGDGADIQRYATFEALGNGFWARDITFRNTAGPDKEQAVAMRVSSNHSIFYRCSFESYQDTLYVESNLQFYHNCQIHGTIDFIFGDAAVVFQKCDIYVRKMVYPKGQSNMITAQRRWFPLDHTGIAIQMSRVLPSPEFEAVKGSYKSFLGRPWKEYSRTVFFQTYLDEFIDPKGWAAWNGSFALSTLFYGEYNNSGGGASTKNRVKWKTFHVLNTQQVMKFTVSRFISGDDWIPESGVPFSPGLL